MSDDSLRAAVEALAEQGERDGRGNSLDLANRLRAILAAHAEVGPVGTTVSEWGVAVDGGVDWGVDEGGWVGGEGEAWVRHGLPKFTGLTWTVVTRQRTTFPDVVTEWTEVTDD